MDISGPVRIYLLTKCTKCAAPVRALFAPKKETVQTCPRCGARKEGGQP
jgi:DNA-directed RNA polymerase subunit RPC12/RpoP